MLIAPYLWHRKVGVTFAIRIKYQRDAAKVK